MRYRRPVSTPLILAFVVTLLTGCGGSSSAPPTVNIGDGDVDGSKFFISGNNSARLSGPVVGDASIDNANLSKSVSFTLLEPSSEIEIVQVYATRDSDSSSTLIAVIHNTTDTTKCSIDLKDVVPTGADGADLVDAKDMFIASSIAVSENGSYRSRCLAPGERAYAFRWFLSASFPDITAVSVGSIDVSPDSWTSAQETVLPISYTINDNNIEVVVQNQSSIAIEVNDLDYFVLDDQGFPLIGDFILITPAILQPGAESVFSDRLDFAGTASTIRVVLDFDPAEPAP